MGDPCAQADPFNVVRYIVSPDAAVSACITNLRASSQLPSNLQTVSAENIKLLQGNLPRR